MTFTGEEDPEDALETYLNLNITLLSLMSIFIGLNGNRDFRKYGVLAKVPILTMGTVIFSVTACIFQFLHSLRIMSTDKNTATILYTNIFSNIICVTKGVCLMYNKGKLQLLLDDLSKMWNDNRPKGECRKNILRRAKNTLTFVKVYIFMTIGLITAIGLPPLQRVFSQPQESLNYTYDYSLRLFIIRYPFDISSPLIYWSLICEEFWILFGLCCSWVSGDTLFASLTTQLMIQFEILVADIKSQIKHEVDETNLKRNIITLVHRHRKILSACEQVEQIFGPIIFVTVVFSSMNICVNTFVVQEKVAVGAYTEAGYHVFVMLNTFLQVIVFCSFAENLTQTALSIPDAVYGCDWTDQNKEIKMYIHILLMKTQNSFYCTAYGFFILTHQQLTKIVNAAMSYYMMLRTTSQ